MFRVARASRVLRQSGSDFRRFAETIFIKVRNREDAVASTRDACATQAKEGRFPNRPGSFIGAHDTIEIGPLPLQS